MSANYRLELSQSTPEKKTRKSANLGDYHADLMLKKLSKISDLMSAEMA
jgi:hypothetical protein